MRFPTSCKRITKSFRCVESVLTSKITGSLFIPPKIKINFKTLIPPPQFRIYPIWQLLKMRKSSWSLMHLLPWTANNLLKWYFHTFLCVCVWERDPFHFMASRIKPSHPPCCTEPIHNQSLHLLLMDTNPSVRSSTSSVSQIRFSSPDENAFQTRSQS